MRIETMGDVVTWSSGFHSNLADFIEASVAQSKDERLKMLSSYIADHERQLAKTIAAFEVVESDNALGTWCTEFLNKQPLPDTAIKDERWAHFSANELMDEVRGIHQQLMALFSHLLSRSAATPAADMLEQLLDVEEHQLMLMAHSANRLEDL
ncbi:hypothetical protein [Zhongshania marina]|uniref:ATPase n=1 Tax=Zhongshania marina TaxID=2304603 RepID=A0ABX9W823_9GAMM|nr:hypothetical protein D0911_03990 [Zhongshania marina]